MRNRSLYLFFYSERKALTGSILAAAREGINPENSVKKILKLIIIIAWYHFNETKEYMPVKWPIIKLPIISKIKVIIIPIIPATAPIINVSALNRCPTSFLRPPSDLITPISFVRSTTDIYVMIPI